MLAVGGGELLCVWGGGGWDVCEARQTQLDQYFPFHSSFGFDHSCGCLGNIEHQQWSNKKTQILIVLVLRVPHLSPCGTAWFDSSTTAVWPSWPAQTGQEKLELSASWLHGNTISLLLGNSAEIWLTGGHG